MFNTCLVSAVADRVVIIYNIDVHDLHGVGVSGIVIRCIPRAVLGSYSPTAVARSSHHRLPHLL